MNPGGNRLAEARIVGFADFAYPVLQQRLVQKPCPFAQHLDLLVAEIVEPPRDIGLARLVVVGVAHRLIQFQHAANEFRREHPDNPEIEQIHRAIRPDLIIAEMRVAMDDAVMIKRHIPGAEQRFGNAVTLVLRWLFFQTQRQRPAFEP